jgi:hypothetical protein
MHADPLILCDNGSGTTDTCTVDSNKVAALNVKTNQEIPDTKTNGELYTDIREVDIDVESCYLFGKATKILPKFTVGLTPARLSNQYFITIN